MAIHVQDLVKDFGNSRGLFGVSLDVPEGAFVGIMGENGAGKSTLLRILMDFVRSDSGKAEILSHDCRSESLEVKRLVAYVPGEINFPDLPTGKDFLREQMQLYGLKDTGKADALIEELQLDIRARPKRMSKGMKQKLAIVSALMLDVPILLLDEPTTGLDPLMRERFRERLAKENADGKTILMTSNTFEDLDQIADSVFLLSQGKILDCYHSDLNDLKDYRFYRIGFVDQTACEAYRQNHSAWILSREESRLEYVVRIPKSELFPFLRELQSPAVRYFYEEESLMEDYFRNRRKQA